MVGRAEQLERLTSLLDIVATGRGRAAFIVGEPGIGKSRLLAELKIAALAPPSTARWFEGRCVSYGRNLPYHLLIDLLRSILGFSFAATESEARAALDAALLDVLGVDQAEAEDTGVYLADLLGLPLRPGEAIQTEAPDVLQGRYIAATHRLLRGLAARGPVVVVCEDIHWADPASIDVARQLMPLAGQLPILFVAALRAETDAPGWALIGHARELFGEALTEIPLEPLTEAGSKTLVANLLEIESLPARVRDLILARSEGNPFFVEEVVRMLIDRSAIVQEGTRWVATADVTSIEIPETLHGLLLARIDQLPDDAKRSLRVAAVIGRQFPVRVLERVIGAEP
jgi:predicted ATPase